MQRTLVLVKPDGVARNLTGEILARFEKRGFKLVALKMLTVTSELAEQHYAEHREKPFFPSLRDFITSSPGLNPALSAALPRSRLMILTGLTQY